jgi:hypothetical protein
MGLIGVFRRPPWRTESNIVAQLIRNPHEIADRSDHPAIFHNECRAAVRPLLPNTRRSASGMSGLSWGGSAAGLAAAWAGYP